MTNSMIWFKSPIAEMKRLYVRAEDRGLGLRRMLAERFIAEAQRSGCGYF